ncbi:MAG: dihydroorotate dehydrogenase-like protein [Bacteroidetes bacterium]|nr:dihydroorotate dehydrogenase-like protein [Bacteroidota bacterium]
MVDLSTKYLGLDLKNPIIVGASNLVLDLNTVKKIEAAGAAAIVYKSLFEEQIQMESLQMHENLHEYDERNAEMISLFPLLEHAGPKEHLTNLRMMKENTGIPVIASLNAIYKESWEEYAQLLENTGVDALELNFFAVPESLEKEGLSIEQQQLMILETVKKAVKIPVSVKLSSFYSNVLNVVAKMDGTGADGFVLFNRLFQPDIDLKSETHFSPFHLSNEEEDNKLPLRYTGLLYDQIKAEICCNTGIYTGQHALKAILAGADTVQVVSAIYKYGISHLSNIIAEMEKWMESKNYHSLADFRGKLSKKTVNDPLVYKRAQYVDILLKSESIFNKYPLH